MVCQFQECTLEPLLFDVYPWTIEVGVRGTASLGNKMLNEEKFGGWSLLEM